MANPAKKLESLLRLHRFELVSQKKHLKYKNPQGKIYVIGKTPSDFRAAHKALTVLERVIVSPVPTSEVIEEERQRRELEATITLQAQPKPTIAGVVGAGKGKKSSGVGIYYEVKKPDKVKLPPTAEELALREEIHRETEAEMERQQAETMERRRARRQKKEWSALLSGCRRAVRQTQKDVNDIGSFAATGTLLQLSRKMAADALREWRGEKPEELAAEHDKRRLVKRLVDGAFFLKHREAYGENPDGEFQRLVDRAAVEALHKAGQFLMHWGGRAPRFYPPFGESLTLTAAKVRMLHRTATYPSELRDADAWEAGILQRHRPPEWLREAVLRLRVGVNKLELEGE